jgi:hypothetical protein
MDRTSSGPSCSVFDPMDLGVGNNSTLVLGYPIATPYRNSGDVTSTYWNKASEPHALCFPDGYRSVLFFGSHGTGSICYGDVPADCTDPVYLDKGYHAYPYRPQVWAFDVADLVAVKNNLIDPEDVLEHAIWDLSTFNLPFYNNHFAGGVAHDVSGKRIFWVARGADEFGLPVIQVFTYA